MKHCLLIPALLVFSLTAQSQIPDWPDDEWGGIPVNYTEANIPSFTLPDPLILNDGTPVTSAAMWFEKRRPEVLELLEVHQFGRTPDGLDGLRVDVYEDWASAFDGKAMRKQVTIYFTEDNDGPAMDLLVYVPPEAQAAVPLLLNISFTSNKATVGDPEVRQGMIWNRDQEHVPGPDEARFGKLDIMPFIEAGFGVATVYYGDIEPDFEGGAIHGIRSMYLEDREAERDSDEWGAIGAWALGLSRVMDYVETDPRVDERRVALTGVSRLGKAVLWAGARDQRFAMVLASCSGQGGAALGSRNYGETIKLIAHPDRFDYWFAPKYATYGDDPDASPVDAHMLLALIAPRPLLLQTGTTDKWSDPRGEFEAALAAEPVYELLGSKGPGTTEVPRAGEPLFNSLGYYMHEGGHGMLPEDWDQFLAFMQLHLNK